MTARGAPLERVGGLSAVRGLGTRHPIFKVSLRRFIRPVRMRGAARIIGGTASRPFGPLDRTLSATGGSADHA